MKNIKLNWINIQDALPEKNVLVLVWRKKYNEPTNIYLAKRNGKKLSTDEDASKDCNWSGSPLNEVKLPSDDNGGIYFDRTFSDVTVIKWSYLF